MRVYVAYIFSVEEDGFQIFPRDFADYDTRTEETEPGFKLFLIFPSQTQAYYWVKEHGYEDSDVVIKAIDIEEFAVKPSKEEE